MDNSFKVGVDGRKRCACTYTLLGLAKARRDYCVVPCSSCAWQGIVTKVWPQSNKEHFEKVRIQDKERAHCPECSKMEYGQFCARHGQR